MDKKVNLLIKKYADNELALNKLVVSSFVRFNGLTVNGGYLAPYAVYTPKYIRDYIVNQVVHSVKKPLKSCLCADISCGCGAFLFTLLEKIREQTTLPYKEILHHLYGVDISAVSIERAKILLSLVALLHGEFVCEEDFRLYCGDSLTFDFKSLPDMAESNGFDIIVGNPPYVRSKNIDAETKKNLPLWKTSKVGNADLYIPFFEIGMTLLNESGLLGYITVNTFFKSVNARALRNYLSENQFSLSIIDFGEQMVFKKKLAYTCLAFLSKSHKDSLMYVKAAIADVQEQKNLIYSKIKYSMLDNHRGWNLNKLEVLENIRLIENAGEALGDKYVIKNGIATLANDVFIFRPTKTDAQYHYLVRDGVEYPIEKAICRDIIKPNILKSEAEIPEKEEKIISPYDANYNVIAEDFFQQHYPCAYKYLSDCRDILDARDKGEGDYGAWYAFGRTQAISDSGRKLLFPYMSDLPHFVYTSQEDMMIYCGYAIYNESETELLFLKKVLESTVFDYYMKNTSKPYATGYYSYAKNYVKNFGLYRSNIFFLCNQNRT